VVQWLRFLFFYFWQRNIINFFYLDFLFTNCFYHFLKFDDRFFLFFSIGLSGQLYDMVWYKRLGGSWGINYMLGCGNFLCNVEINQLVFVNFVFNYPILLIIQDFAKWVLLGGRLPFKNMADWAVSVSLNKFILHNRYFFKRLFFLSTNVIKPKGLIMWGGFSRPMAFKLFLNYFLRSCCRGFKPSAFCMIRKQIVWQHNMVLWTGDELKFRQRNRQSLWFIFAITLGVSYRCQQSKRSYSRPILSQVSLHRVGTHKWML
jgi:hypothetical protein